MTDAKTLCLANVPVTEQIQDASFHMLKSQTLFGDWFMASGELPTLAKNQSPKDLLSRVSILLLGCSLQITYTFKSKVFTLKIPKNF